MIIIFVNNIIKICIDIMINILITCLYSKCILMRIALIVIFIYLIKIVINKA